MADLCLPLCAGEDTFELHSVAARAGGVERRIHELLGKQAQLRKRKATLETSRADAHKSGVSMQRAANTPTTSTRVFLAQAPCTRDAIITDGLHYGAGKPRTLCAAAEDAIQARATTSPPPVFDISSGTASPLSARLIVTLVVIGDSIVRHVRATLAEGKVHTHVSLVLVFLMFLCRYPRS